MVFNCFFDVVKMWFNGIKRLVDMSKKHVGCGSIAGLSHFDRFKGAQDPAFVGILVVLFVHRSYPTFG